MTIEERAICTVASGDSESVVVDTSKKRPRGFEKDG